MRIVVFSVFFNYQKTVGTVYGTSCKNYISTQSYLDIHLSVYISPYCFLSIRPYKDIHRYRTAGLLERKLLAQRGLSSFCVHLLPQCKMLVFHSYHSLLRKAKMIIKVKVCVFGCTISRAIIF